MSANRSTRFLIIVLGVVLGALIGGGLYMARNAFAPPEARIDPTAQIVVLGTEGVVGRSAPLEIRFNQKMNQESVLAALTIAPSVEYSATWAVVGSGEKVILTPKSTLAWDTTYTLTLAETAQNNRGRALVQPVTVTFATAREVQIVTVFPADGAEDVAPTEAITVRFDQAVVDPDVVEATTGVLQPIVIEPAVVGSGQWLSPDTYAFFPTAGLTSGTDYTVRVQPQIAPALELETSYRWQFNTAGPRLTASYPFDGAGEVERATAITLLFDQPMDRDSVEENFLLSTGGEAVEIAGDFVWTDDHTLAFRPAEALQVATPYTVTVGTEALAAGGTYGLGSPYRAVFTTVDFLAVESVQPAPGSTEVTIAPTDTVIAVQFNHPVVSILGLSERENLPSPITIAPRLAGQGEWVTTSLFVFRPTEPLQPSTEYRVTVPQGTQDALGAYLQEAYGWTFTTEYPRVLRMEPTNQNNFVSPTGPIGLRFNQGMEEASTEAAFALRLEGETESIPGRFEWADGNTLLNFYPNTPLVRDAGLTITLAEGAQGQLGGETFTTYSATVSTPPLPGIIRTNPQDGTLNAPRYAGLTLTFASPMDPDLVEDYVTFSPQATEFFTSYDAPSFTFNFYPRNFALLPAESTYMVTVDGDLPDATGQPLGDNYTFQFTTEAAPPILQVASDYGRIGTYNPFTATVQLIRHRNLETLDFTLYRLTETQLLEAMGERGFQFIDEYSANPATAVAEWSVDVELAKNITPLRTLIPPDSEIERSGAYFLRVSTPDMVEYQEQMLSPVSNMVMIYTPINLTIKRAPREVLVWATDIQTGEPVANTPIALYRGTGALISEGTTDENGLYRYEADDITELGYPYDRVNALSLNGAGEILGATGTAFTADLYGGLWNVDQNLTPDQLYGTIYSERPIYRPGHTVYFKGIVRQLDGMTFQVPELTRPMKLTVNSFNGEVYTTEVEVSDFGTFAGEFVLEEDAETGYYTFLLEQSEFEVCYGTASCYYPSLGGSFQVAEYVRPEFEVIVTPETETFIEGGSELTATVAANYYFGGVVADAPFNYRVLARRHYFTSPYVAGYWTWGDYDSYLPIRGYFGDYDSAEMVVTDNGMLNRDGTATITIPSGLTVQPNQAPASQELLIEADVSDVNDRVVTGRSQIVLHAGAFYIGLKSEEYFGAKGQPFAINVATAAPTGELVGGQSMTLDLYLREYNTERQENSDGSATFVTTFTDTLESTAEVTTDSEGYGTATFVPEQGGSYVVLARGEDAQGNEIRSRYYFWVSDGEFVSWGDSAENAIQLRSDQLTYTVGETAEILVPTPYEGMTALITIEQNGILQTEVRLLPTTADVIEVPITEEMIPNVYVSVVVVRGAEQGQGIPEFRMGVANLQVEPREKTLDVALIPQVEDVNSTFQPGDEATYTLQVTDKDGAPIQAEVSVAVVDKATLALATEQAPQLLAIFYRLRPLSVVTASDLTININRIIRALDPIIEGGGGGGGGGSGDVGLSVREELVDTAYWQADIRTDENGQADLSFTLPDNLTTWVLTARAVTSDSTLVGETTGELLSTKPVLIRPTLPRFVVRGDQFFVRLVANNNTDEVLEATLGYSETGLSQAEGDETAEVVTLPARGQAVVEFPVTVENVNEVTIVAEVVAGVYEDRVSYTLPVYYLTAPETVGTGGVVRSGEGGTVETIRVPANAEPAQGELMVEVAPSLAGATRNSLETLESYDYQTVEARTSVLLPNLATYRAIQVMGVNRPDVALPLAEQIPLDIGFLVEAQNDDGGWGWWSHSTESLPWLSAYTFLALQTAQQDGFEVPDGTLEAGADYLNAYLRQTRVRQDNAILDTRAFMLYVLSEGGNANAQAVQALFDQRTFLNPDGKAFLLLALDNGEDNRAQVQTLAAELTASARLSATGSFWEEPTPDLFALDSTLRTTSVVLRALVRVEPEYALLPQTVRWLMHSRQGDWWEGTHTTAWAIWALTDYMEATGELEGNFTYEVALNDEIVLSEQVNADNITEPISLSIAIADLVLNGDNRLIVTPQPPANSEMDGRLYYQAWLKYALPLEDSPARFEGIQVSRSYERADPDTFTTTGIEVSEVQPGDVVLVRVTMNAPNDLSFLTLEDPIPAGFEIIDQSLATTSQAADAPDVERVDPNKGVFWYDGWSQVVIRDEKVALFANVLPRGTYEYTYLIRAVVPGTYGVLPTYAYQTFHPEVFGRSEGTEFRIVEE
jgi:uncharacterized protein YfaS (alpha-2-macroglobulin family)